MMNSPSGSYAPMEEIPEDTTVCDANGEKVGTVTHSAMRDGYFVIEKGVIFTHELYLPASTIQARDADRITLLLSKEELQHDQWKQPPGSVTSGAAAQPAGYPDFPMSGSDQPEDEAFDLSDEASGLPPEETESPMLDR